MSHAKAFILAAGLGTRLRPLTLTRPKPLCPVCGVTILEQAIALCEQHGLIDLVVNAHHLSDEILRFVDSGILPSRLRVHVQVEQPAILGTGGALRQARPHLAESFVVVNGDVLCDADLGALLGCVDADAGSPFLAAMLLRADPQAGRYGIVTMDEAGRVNRLADLANLAGSSSCSNDTHFTGIHALRREALSLLPPDGPACVVRSVYRALVPEGRVRGVLHGGAWLDAGEPRDYLEACRAVLHGRLRLPIDPWSRAAFAFHGEVPELPDRCAGPCEISPRARLVPPIWVGRGAVIEADARVGPDVVVGERARVGRGARLEGCVLWDAAVVPSDEVAVDAIFHDRGTLFAPRTR
jgi:mannose-1-phosphate guanylyltransferase